ncbi:MAG: D-amino acid aminotransferase [Bordetella sp.]|nr:MAG: D-amino acid aminotransferase [Bordetella sp.]
MVFKISDNDQVYLNGQFIKIEDAKVSVLDRGFIFGDGVYELIPIYNKNPFCMNEHLDRLEANMSSIKIQSPLKRSEWSEIIIELINRNDYITSAIYLQVTRGVYKREHAFPNEIILPTVFAMSSPFTPPNQFVRKNGLKTIGISDERWLNCNIKSISLLGNILAKQQAVEAGVDEVLQFRNGFLTEGSSSNIWVVYFGKLMAPIKSNLILEGVRYELLIKLAKQSNIPFEACNLSEKDIINSNELILTSAMKEILPIVSYNGKTIGNGKPGPIFIKLREGYDALISKQFNI